MNSIRYAFSFVLCHVLAISLTVSQRNVALHKPCVGTTTDLEEATDSGTHPANCAFLMDSADDGLWLIVDLENQYVVQSVRIYKIPNYFTQYEFENFFVYTSVVNPYPDVVFTKGEPFPGEECLYHDSPLISREWNDLPCQKNTTGRFVTVWFPAFSGYVYLCELEVITDQDPLLPVPGNMALSNTIITLDVEWGKRSESKPYHSETLSRASLPVCALACLTAKEDVDYYAGRSMLAQLETTSRLCQCVVTKSFDNDFSLSFVHDPHWALMEMHYVY